MTRPFLALLLGCSPESVDSAPPVSEPRPAFAMDVAAQRAGDLWAAPFPGPGVVDGDGVVSVGAFPNPGGAAFVDQVVAVLDGRAVGAGRTSGVFFAAPGDIDPSVLPDLFDSVASDVSVQLVDVDERSPERGRRIPVEVVFHADPGPHGPERTLSLVPLQGVPLRPGTQYAAVVTSAVGDFAALEGCPSGWTDADCAGVSGVFDWGELVAATTFRTGAQEQDVVRWADHARATALAAAPESFDLVEVFDDYCVFAGETSFPVYQSGTPPYRVEGGAIVEDADGAPVLDHWEPSRVVVTLPRSTPPDAGFPVVTFIRTGGGGDRPLVDRGVRDETGEPIDPGSGLAREFAQVGWAGIQVDGPHGGVRNITGGDEQFLMFNVQNPAALIDNVRQSALEIALVPGLVEGVSIDASACPGIDATASLDADQQALFGHSMGATIAPLTLAAAPEYRGVMLSGAGGSWIENVIWKESPLAVRPIAEAMLGYDDRELTAHDPVLSMLQWAGEGADPPVFGPGLQETDLEVLMLQGIVDTYILPPIANATSLSHGLDLAGPALDADHPDLAHFRPLGDVLPLVGGDTLDLPAGANRDGRTRLVIQHAEDGVEDGHEVVFQTAAPKRQIQAFLTGLADGGPTMPE